MIDEVLIRRALAIVEASREQYAKAVESCFGLRSQNATATIWPHNPYQYGFGMSGMPEPPPPAFGVAPVDDATAFRALLDVDHLQSIQDRVEALHRRGYQLCKKTTDAKS